MESGNAESRPERGRGAGDRKAETKQRLLEAAEDVFGRLGFHDASIVQITEKAGVALGTFYVHFPSKTDAFLELVRARRDELRVAAFEAAANKTTHREKIRAAFMAFFEGIARHRGAFRLTREAEFVEPSLIRELFERPVDEFRLGLEQDIAEGRLPKHDTEIVAWCASGMAEFVAMRWIIWNEDSLPADKFDAFVDALLRLVDSPEVAVGEPSAR